MVPDLSVKEKGEKRAHVTVLAQNRTGWENICKMLTVANINGYFYRPRIDPELLIDNCEGVIVGTACASSFMRWPRGKGIEIVKKLRAKGAFVYFEVMPIDLDEQRMLNQQLVEYSEFYNIPLVATNDCHYIKAEQNKVQEVLLAIQTKRKWNDPNRWRFTVDTLFLQSVDEMESYFVKYGGITEANYQLAMKNTKMIADMCNLELEAIPVELPDVDIEKYPGMEPNDCFIKLIMDGWEYRKNKHPWITDEKEPEYMDRLMEEVNIICSLGFAAYFLIVYELINWCKENDIMTGPGRGSVGGSLVSYCMGITQVDPLKYDLVFSRFISEARIDLPDIDMDFEKSRRKDVIEHLKDLYGEYNIIGISNFMSMKGKSALKDAARVFDIPKAEVEKASDAIVTRSGGDMRSDFTITDAFETFEDGIKFKAKYPEVAQLSIDLEGQIRGHGRHAAGICISKTDLRDGANCAYAKRSDTLCANWDKKDSEFNGLMKLDVLGLQSLDVLHQAQKLIKARKGVDIDYEDIELDDAETLEEFNRGNCVGIFQFNGNSIMRFCRDIGISEFEDVVALNALHRPGTLKSGTIHQYKDRKHGREPVTYPHPLIESITKPTQGIILYQEQVMRLMYECGGLPWRTTDTIRKAVSKSQGEAQLNKFKDDFIQGCLKANTLNEKEANDIFETIKSFGAYGFNKSHSVEYSLISYWQMWLRVKYPMEYMISILSYGQEKNKADNMQEARRLGLKIALPDINLSNGTEWAAAGEDKLLIPIGEIKGIGPAALKSIMSARKDGPFVNEADFESRVNKRVVNSKIRNLLNITYCWADKTDLELDEAKLEYLSTFFNFSLSNDPMYKYRKLLNKIRTCIDIKMIATAEPGDIIWGYVDKITYQIKTDGEAGIAYSGCYGQLKDEEGNYIMMNFERELYQERKDDIEHSEGKWVAIRISTKREDSVIVSSIWYADDMLKGEFEKFEYWSGGIPQRLALAEYSTVDNRIMEAPLSNDVYGPKRLQACTMCDLSSECSNPVYPSEGTSNIMIIGESPNQGDDRQGLALYNNMIWNGDPRQNILGLSDFNISPNDVWNTTFIKCWPSATKKPKKKHFNKCTQWLEKEIKAVNPFLILAFGNMGLKFFRDKDGGIMDASGDVRWNDQFQAFVVNIINPNMLYFAPENAEIYNRGLLSFVDKYLGLGWK
jgi:DNA polymerase-3 subunit alpha